MVFVVCRVYGLKEFTVQQNRDHHTLCMHQMGRSRSECLRVHGWKVVYGTKDKEGVELTTLCHIGCCRSACHMEFMVGKEFTVGKGITLQQKKRNWSQPQVVRVSHRASMNCMHQPKCMHHIGIPNKSLIYDITPLILINSFATIFSNSTIFNHNSGIFFQTPPPIPNTPSHSKHPLPFQTPPPTSNSLSQCKLVHLSNYQV